MQSVHSRIAALAVAAVQQSGLSVVQSLSPPELWTNMYLSSQIDSTFLAAPSGVAFFIITGFGPNLLSRVLSFF